MSLFKIVSVAMFVALAAPPAVAQDAGDTSRGAAPLSFKACGVKYRAAKADGMLNGQKWLDYRKIHCGIVAPVRRLRPVAARSEPARTEALRRLAFPAALASEFSSEKPSTARMRTCLKSYRQNKQAGALYGIRWVEKGGGYYSLCAARLKASA